MIPLLNSVIGVKSIPISAENDQEAASSQLALETHSHNALLKNSILLKRSSVYEDALLCDFDMKGDHDSIENRWHAQKTDDPSSNNFLNPSHNTQQNIESKKHRRSKTDGDFISYPVDNDLADLALNIASFNTSADDTICHKDNQKAIKIPERESEAALRSFFNAFNNTDTSNIESYSENHHNIHPLLLPEILDPIFRIIKHTDPKTLQACLLVCRTWHVVSSCVVWHTLSFNRLESFIAFSKTFLALESMADRLRYHTYKRVATLYDKGWVSLAKVKLI